MEEDNISLYDLFQALIGILSIILLSLLVFIDFSNDNVENLLHTFDITLCIIFFCFFIINFKLADKKIKYLYIVGWIELVSCIPYYSVLSYTRVIKLVKLLKIFKLLNSGKILYGLIHKHKTKNILFATISAVILTIIISSISILLVENQENCNIVTASDALWWTFVTITTVGYGDRYPVTNEGRVIGMCVMIVGISTFGVLSGSIASMIANNSKNDEVEDLKNELSEIKSILIEMKTTPPSKKDEP